MSVCVSLFVCFVLCAAFPYVCVCGGPPFSKMRFASTPPPPPAGPLAPSGATRAAVCSQTHTQTQARTGLRPLACLCLLAILSAATADLCTPLVNVDCVGNDVEIIRNCTSTQQCCTACQAQPWCVAWSWDYLADKGCYLKTACPSPISAGSISGIATANTTCGAPSAGPVWTCALGARVLSVYKDGSYDVAVRGTPWLTGGSVAVHVDGAWYGAQATGASALSLASAGPVSGSDALGPYTGWALNWKTASGTPLTTAFSCYTEEPLVAFVTTWPAGGSNTQTSQPSSSWSSPIVHFPSFAACGALGEDLRWLVSEGIWTIFEIFGTGVASGFPGADSPVWLFNATQQGEVSHVAPGQPRPPVDTLILSPLNSFKATRVHVVADPIQGARVPMRLVAGLYSTVQSVPAGFSSSYGMFSGEGGVSAATLQWGPLLQALHGTKRYPTAADTLNGKLSYWSDNGATLFQGYWDMVCPDRNCTAAGTNAQQVFAALKDYHTQEHIPAALYQLDTWWFYQSADKVKGGDLDCVEWKPRADLFPDGLPALTRHGDGGIPLLLYSWSVASPFPVFFLRFPRACMLLCVCCVS